LRNLAPREGGWANRDPAADPGGPTNKGMSQKELNRLRRAPEWKHLPARAKSLTEGQIENIYRVEYFERAQIEKLANVSGLSKAAPNLAEQVFDAGVQHGILDPGTWLQRSLDEAIGTDLRVSARNGGAEYDGIVGTDTRTALEQAVRAGKAAEINDRIVDRRIRYMRSLPNIGPNAGWIPRAESFRSGPSLGTHGGATVREAESPGAATRFLVSLKANLSTAVRSGTRFAAWASACLFEELRRPEGYAASVRRRCWFHKAACRIAGKTRGRARRRFRRS
jgi:lysozyme family protein